MQRLPKIVSEVRASTRKMVQDTVEGCRKLAEADLARASLMNTANGRRRLESSALSWTSRAEMIQREDEGFNVRRAIARAEWDDGEAPSRKRSDPDLGGAS